jgi:hypothetical protein
LGSGFRPAAAGPAAHFDRNESQIVLASLYSRSQTPSHQAQRASS